MGDLSLDLNRTSLTFGDLVLNNGDLVINSGVEAVRQNIIQKLKTYLGEWFLDNRIGVPYYEQILIKNPKQGNVDAIFQNVILSTPGVLSLDRYRTVFDTTQRRYELSFHVTTTEGVIDYSGAI